MHPAFLRRPSLFAALALALCCLNPADAHAQRRRPARTPQPPASVGPPAATADRLPSPRDGRGFTPGDASKRAAVLRQVAENAALRQRETGRAFVLMQFYGYLRRNPDDAPEAGLNFAGWKFWLDKLNEFNGNYVQAEMVKAFISSDEYVKRFGQ